MASWRFPGGLICRKESFAVMHLYLPLAGLSVNVVLLLSVGGGVGFLSGLFGVGGGFLLTPLLLFMGIPAAVAVASGANQVVGASVSGMLAHWRRGNVDVRMGALLVLGGLGGSLAGVRLFAWLQQLGQLEFAIQTAYVGFLGLIGSTMLIESLRALYRRAGAVPSPRRRQRWAFLPFKMRFPRSGLEMNPLPPLVVGAVGGLLSAVLGVGGGIVLVPLMIYLLEIPTAVVIGTSLFQVIFVTANVTILHAVHTQSVDVILMLALLVGGVIGAQFGARIGGRLRAEQMRLLLALLVLAVCGGLLFSLVATPSDLYNMTISR